jgi:metallo-beta-lactamase family protein
MTATLQCFGAARTVTGSRHLLENGGTRILLDCGQFQGHRRESNERNRHLPVLPLDALLLSHAHIDHSGAIPRLVADGYRGEIHATDATVDLCAAMLADAASLAEKDAEWWNRHAGPKDRPIEPLFTREDVDRAMRRFRGHPYGKAFEPAPGVTALFRDAGHIIGSAGILVEYRGGPRVYFTGDLGRRPYPILRDPEPLPRVDAVISEATYGCREHEPVDVAQEKVRRILERAHEQKGKVFVPAFSVGRAQNIVYGYARALAEGRIRPIPMYVDSPLAMEAMKVLRDHPGLHDTEMRAFLASGGRPFDPPGVTYVESVEESKRLNHTPGPMVVIAGSGMCEGGRIVHHLKHGISDPRNTILFVGYAAPDTLARRLVDGEPVVRIHRQAMEVRAQVERIGAYSAHADRSELRRFLAPAKAYGASVFLVHGDEDACLCLADDLRHDGHQRVEVPEAYARYPLVSG